MNIFTTEFDKEKYIIVKYNLTSRTTIRDAAWGLAIGQSVGNPNVRNEWETDELFQNHSCLILDAESNLQKSHGEVSIAFPVINIDFKEDGIAHFLCMIMGGQLDIDIIEKCSVLDIQYPDCVKKHFLGPKFGIKGVRDFVGVNDAPLIGGIIKPKTGIPPSVLLDMVKQLVEGGANFIKEDEIMASPVFCRLEDRVPLISKYLENKKVVYCYTINADPHNIINKVKKVYDLGGRGVHINFWSGFGAYKSIREMNLPIFLHFQKSGDKILTNKNHDYHISWKVICELATMMGVDFIHAGMWGGYMNMTEAELQEVLSVLQSGGTIPALSCGLHPGLVKAISNKFGNDLLLNAGGAVHGHPQGTTAGMKALVQAANGHVTSPEYLTAIKKWGIVE